MSINYYNIFQKENGAKFRNQANGFGFNVFLLYKLPSAFFSGVRLVKLDEKQCQVKVPYKWFSQNPFKSTYFACLAMAAEMSTGLPCLMAIDKMDPKVSMLVVDLQSTFTKKATDITIFTCNDIPAVYDAVKKAIETKIGQTVETSSIGLNKSGEEVASFKVTWSFKSK
jgi:hypothetical protein